MHDAMALENKGVATLLICNEPFRNSAQAHARAFGRKEYEVIILPHLWPTDDEGLRGLAQSVFEQAVAMVGKE